MHKQKGMTMVSWIIVISFIGIFAVAALQIIPSYLSFFSARSVIEKMKTDSNIKGKTPSEIKALISKRFGMNNLRHIDVKKAISFKNRGVSEGSGFIVKLNYEDRGKIIGNLFFVTVHAHEAEFNP